MRSMRKSTLCNDCLEDDDGGDFESMMDGGSCLVGTDEIIEVEIPEKETCKLLTVTLTFANNDDCLNNNPGLA